MSDQTTEQAEETSEEDAYRAAARADIDADAARLQALRDADAAGDLVNHEPGTACIKGSWHTGRCDPVAPEAHDPNVLKGYTPEELATLEKWKNLKVIDDSPEAERIRADEEKIRQQHRPDPDGNPYTGKVRAEEITDEDERTNPQALRERANGERMLGEMQQDLNRETPGASHRDAALFHHAMADELERRADELENPPAAASEPEPASTYPTTPLTDEERAHAAGMVAVLADPDDGAMRAIPAGTPAWMAAAQTTCMYQRRVDGDDPSEDEWREAQERAEEHFEDIGDYENDTQEEKERVMANQAVSYAADAGMNRGDEETVRELTEEVIGCTEEAVGYSARAKFDREVERTKEELAEERKQEEERNARARAAMLDQAGQPGGIDVDAAHLLPREVEALKQLRDEGKLNMQFIDPDTGETLDEWREGARVIVTLKPEEPKKEEPQQGMAEFAGNDPNRCGVDSPFGPHRFHPSTVIRVHRYDPMRMTCWKTPDDPVHDPASMCGSVVHDRPHPFEPKQGTDFNAFGICGWTADAEIHNVPAEEQPTEQPTEQSDAGKGDAGPATDSDGAAGGGATSGVHDLNNLLEAKKRRAIIEAQDAAIAAGRSMDDEVDTRRVVDWMGQSAIAFSAEDVGLVVALETAEKGNTQACTGLKTATQAVVAACGPAIEMAARHVEIATRGGAGEPYNNAA